MNRPPISARRKIIGLFFSVPMLIAPTIVANGQSAVIDLDRLSSIAYCSAVLESDDKFFSSFPPLKCSPSELPSSTCMRGRSEQLNRAAKIREKLRRFTLYLLSREFVSDETIMAATTAQISGNEDFDACVAQSPGSTSIPPACARVRACESVELPY